MTPFILIEDNRRLTLQMCEMPRARYTWFLFMADCEPAGFGRDRLIAASAALAGESEAKQEGMSALLEQKRRIAFPAVVTLPSVRDQPLEPVDRHVIDQLLEDISDRADALANMLQLLRQRLSVADERPAPLPVLTNDAEEARQPAVSVQQTWRLLEGRFSLLSPEGKSVILTRTEYQFLLALFQAPGCCLTYQQTHHAIYAQESASPRSPGSISVLLSRLRAKFRKLDVELPLHTLRGQAYVFSGKATILAR
ncbi:MULTISPECIES: helix-turn-helix domain-containing protein [unclassified Achromobacter]|uniref:helix-turn-helix domain-containing protein n=1 Tax=unclassified Achromobacter TaxID=2626865 RepID=UPI001178A039|nr:MULTISPECIES: helix-turn-helix domain-containing protein [unclassified Achromobacter]